MSLDRPVCGVSGYVIRDATCRAPEPGTPGRRVQTLSHHQQLRQSTREEQSIGIVHQYSVSDLWESEDVFDETGQVLETLAHL